MKPCMDDGISCASIGYGLRSVFILMLFLLVVYLVTNQLYKWGLKIRAGRFVSGFVAEWEEKKRSEANGHDK